MGTRKQMVKRPTQLLIQYQITMLNHPIKATHLAPPPKEKGGQDEELTFKSQSYHYGKDTKTKKPKSTPNRQTKTSTN